MKNLITKKLFIGLIGAGIIVSNPSIIRQIDRFLATPAGATQIQKQAEDTWKQMKAMPTARILVNSVAINNRIYCIGGSTFGPNLNDNEEFDPEKNTWQIKAKMNFLRWSFSADAFDNKIYVFGGTVDGPINPFSDVEVYDIKTDKWEILDDIPEPKGQHSSAVVNGEIYLISGVNAGGQTKSVFAYNPINKTYIKKADIPQGSSFGAACSLNGKIYYIGGITLK